MKNKPAPPKVTLRTLAEQLGISHSTVSRALRNDARITAALRQKVERLADKLGYVRDPRIAELMTHLRRGKERTHQGALAWVTDLGPELPQSGGVMGGYVEAAALKAAALGYRLDHFPAVKPADAGRLAATFRGRNIKGVVLHLREPFRAADWPWDWAKYSIVQIGSPGTDLPLDTVDADDTGNHLELFPRLAALGYQRIGVATSLAVERALAFSLSGSRRRFALIDPRHEAFPEFYFEDKDPEASVKLKAWKDRYGVDCIVSHVPVEPLLKAQGLRVPEDVGVAFQGVGPASPQSGIFRRDDAIATTAVETVVLALEQGRSGIPAVPRRILLRGLWQAGSTTRQGVCTL